MASLPGSGNPRQIEQLLNDMFPADWLRETASAVGCVQRQRKVDPVTFFWVLVLGFGVGVQRSLASLRRAYETVAGETLVPSAFYDRFHPKLLAFLRACLTRGIDELVAHTSLALGEKLQGFKDVVVADGTILRLHDQLAPVFPGARHLAELKIHLVSGITTNTKTIRLYPGKTAEIQTLRVGAWVRDCILLFDLGYFKYQLFSRIRRNGGHFVSRLKDSANPTIVRVLRTHRGAVRDLTGQRLRDILPGLQREVLDVEVAVTFRRRVYRGRTTPATERFRLVGVRDPETGAYHCYLTDLSPEQLSAEDVAQLYRARWSIELLFKELKRLYQLDVITSAAPVVVEALVLTALLTLVVSHRILNHLRSLVPAQAARFTPLRWAEVFTAATIRLLPQVLAVAGVTDDPFWVMLFMMQEAPDPNLTRDRLLDPWTQPQPLDG